MKTLVSASVLSLIATTAMAGDYYGNFASPELETTVSSSSAAMVPATASPNTIQTSLYTFDPEDANVPLATHASSQGVVVAHLQPAAYSVFVYDDD
jgi:hypothetical protein